jgi:hypothetical protein
MADFHAADLWVAVIPETSKVGPAMEEAGKEAKKKFGDGIKDFGKTIHDDLDKVGSKAKDTFSNIGKHAKDVFSRAGKESGDEFSDKLESSTKDRSKGIGTRIGETVGTELGKAFADKVTNLPGFDKLRESVQKATKPIQGIADAIHSVRDADLKGAMAGVDDALTAITPLAKTIGVDISGWHLPPEINTKVSDLSTKFSDAHSSVKGVTGMLGELAGSSPRVSGALETIGKAAGPLAIDFAVLQTALPIINAQLHEIASIKPGVDTSLGALGLPGAYTGPTTQLPGPARGIPGPRVATGPGGEPLQQRPGPGGGMDIPGMGKVPLPMDILPPGATSPIVPNVGPSDLFPRDLPGQAGGGPLFGSGPKGKDSGLFFGADGEHVWTADEVDAAGGHGGMRALRAMALAGFFKKVRGYQGGGGIGASAGSGPKLNTYGAQVDTIAIAEAIAKLFGISNIGMYRAADRFPEHPSGEAADVMVGLNNPVGYQIKDWALSNAAAYDVLYCIWQQAMWYPGGKREPMEDRGSPTENHRDHVHIRTAGGGYPKGGQPAGAPSPSGTKSTPASAVSGGIPGGGGGLGGLGGGGGLSGILSAGGAGGGGGGGLSSLLGGGGAGGGAGGAGGGPAGAGQQYGQQLGQGLVNGFMQAIGLDGSVFGGKSPLDWGAVKLGMGVLNWGLGTAKAKGLMGDSGGGGGGMAGGGGGVLSGLAGLIPGAGAGPSISAAAGLADNAAAAGLGGGPTQITVDNSMSVHGNTVKDTADLISRFNWEHNSTRGGIGSQVKAVSP